MVKRKKPRKKAIVEHEVYQIAMKDWEVYSNFGVDHRKYSSGAYWEISNLILMGEILSPELKIASKAKVTNSADPEQEDHWSNSPTITSANAIGFMEVPRGEVTLQVYCRLPPRLSNNLQVAAASGKIKHVAIFGTKLKWRRGDVTCISLSTFMDE